MTKYVRFTSHVPLYGVPLASAEFPTDMDSDSSLHGQFRTGIRALETE